MQEDINGNPYVGVFCKCNDDYLIISGYTPKKALKRICEALSTESIKTTISGSNVIGSLCIMNSRCIGLNRFVYDEEVDILSKYMKVVIFKEKLNALGNNILINDRAALVHPQIRKTTMKKIEDFFDVEVERGTIANLKTVGSAAVVTNNGMLCHPKISDDERDFLESFFKCEIHIGTANFGSPMIGACVVANTKGAVTGTTSTGIELGRIEEGLKLY